MAKRSKFVQIAACTSDDWEGYLFALDDEGQIWYRRLSDSTWFRDSMRRDPNDHGKD